MPKAFVNKDQIWLYEKAWLQQSNQIHVNELTFHYISIALILS